MDIKNLDHSYIAQTYGRYDLAITDGEPSGFLGDGREYIDFGSGIAVNTFGASEAGWVEAVCAQAKKLSHTSNYFYTEPQSRLAETLCTRTGLKRVFFSNSGAEANECAIKAARKYSHDKYGDGRATILTLENSFHGRTITTLSATGQTVFHTDFMPFTPGFAHIRANDIAALEGALTADVCAVMMEPVQGEGGVPGCCYLSCKRRQDQHLRYRRPLRSGQQGYSSCFRLCSIQRAQEGRRKASVHSGHR